MKRALFLIAAGVIALLILDHTAAATGDGEHNPCDSYQGSTWPHHDPCQPVCEEKPWKCQPTTTVATTHPTTTSTTSTVGSTSTTPAPTTTVATTSTPPSLSPSTTTGSSLPPPVTVTPPTSSVALIPPVAPTTVLTAAAPAALPETGFNQLAATVALILLCLGIACFIVQRIWPL